jgi:hypothetical protein
MARRFAGPHARSGEVLVLFEPRLGCRQIGLVLIYHGLIGAWIDFGAKLPRLHFHIGVAIERLNQAGHASEEGRRRQGLTMPLAVTMRTTEPRSIFCVT